MHWYTIIAVVVKNKIKFISYDTPLKMLSGIQRTLAGSKNAMCSTKFLFFLPI